MKGYKKFIAGFCIVLALYLVVEYNRPKDHNWEVTLENNDKNPFGAYILYERLSDLFPKAAIESYRMPLYNQVNNFSDSNTAYLLIAPELNLSTEDIHALMKYVQGGNYVFMAASEFGNAVHDTLHFKSMRRFDVADSLTISLSNQTLDHGKQYGFKRLTLDSYLDKMDSARPVILGTNRMKDANFVKISHGAGAIFVHALPICFSNYFMVTRNHAAYTAAALSYLPPNVKSIFWDEYYKAGLAGSTNPLRFVLSNRWLAWAFRLGFVTIVIFVLFEMKRKQRVIPEIVPLKNSTVDFVRTVGDVYFNGRNNKNIAEKKIIYFMDYVRSNLFISTVTGDETFVHELTAKTGIAEEKIALLSALMQQVQHAEKVSDGLLLGLNTAMDEFYKDV